MKRLNTKYPWTPWTQSDFETLKMNQRNRAEPEAEDAEYLRSKERLGALGIVEEVEAMLPPPRRREKFASARHSRVLALKTKYPEFASDVGFHREREARRISKKTFQDRPGRISSQKALSFLGGQVLRSTRLLGTKTITYHLEMLSQNTTSSIA